MSPVLGSRTITPRPSSSASRARSSRSSPRTFGPWPLPDTAAAPSPPPCSAACSRARRRPARGCAAPIGAHLWEARPSPRSSVQCCTTVTLVAPRAIADRSPLPSFVVTRVGYLGPRGTFAEEALRTQADLAACEAVPLRTVPQVITAVERGDIDVGLVPLENSIEGTVTVTLDTLAFDTDLLVQREVDLPVSLHLAAKPGHVARATSAPSISHPNPLGQCRGWLATKLPDAELVAANSTADAASAGRGRRRSAMSRRSARSRGAELAGLEVLASEIEDHPENETALRARRAGASRRPPGTTRRRSCASSATTGLARCSRSSRSSRRAPSTSRSSSRDRRSGASAQYCFFIDFEGHINDEVVGRLPAQPRREPGGGEVPRLVPGRGRGRPRAPPGRERGVERRRARGSTHCAAQVRTHAP